MPDGVFLTWDVLAGLLVAAALTGVVGHLTGALLYTRQQFARHKRMLFDPDTGAIPTVRRELSAEIAAVRDAIPVVPTVAEIVAALPKLPEIPTLEEIAAEVQARVPAVPSVAEIIAEIPPYPDLSDKIALLEERMGARLSAQMDAKWPEMQAQIATRVSQVVQANIASAKAAFARGSAEGAAPAGASLGVAGEILGLIMDQETVEKLARAKMLYDKGKAQGGGKFDLKSLLGGGGGGNGGALPPPGTRMTDAAGRPWFFTGDPAQGTGGWVLVNQAPAQPAYVAPAALPEPAAPPPGAAGELPPELPPPK